MSDDDLNKTRIAFQIPKEPPKPAAPRPAPQASTLPPAAHTASASMPADAPQLDTLLTDGEERLVGAAMGLLLLAARLRHTVDNPNVSGLKQACQNQIRQFETKARQLGYADKHVNAARYALCTLIDEAVMKTPWGANSGWSAQTLLMHFHGETWGGDKFFQILDRISEDPQQFLDLIELCYFAIALGLVGRYGVETGGEAKLNAIRDKLFRLIVARRENTSDELSPHWRGIQDKRNAVVRLVPGWVLGTVALAIVIATFFWFRSLLINSVQPISAELAQVGLEPYIPTRNPIKKPILAEPAAPPPPTLRSLLSDAEKRGDLLIEEKDGKTIVAISFGNLFASAQASLNPKYLPLWEEIAAALEKVPGRVLVVGHTDDLPLRSLAFQDNYELSRRRAESASKILQQHLSSPGRIEFNGVGPSQPRYTPANLPENRARNRRVEVNHWAEVNS